MMKTPILMIDDDAGLAAPLMTYFERYDLKLDHAATPEQGLALLQAKDYAFLVLDIMLPGMDGFEVCRRVRQFSDIPIIMLTARGEVTDRIVGLELGADDYLAKPFDPRELVARIQRLLKRLAASVIKPPVFDAGANLQINQTTQVVHLDGKQLDLTSREFALLDLFSQSAGKLYSRDDIMNQLRGNDADVYSRAIDVSISRLRKKLHPLDPIKTIWGRGYRWVL